MATVSAVTTRVSLMLDIWSSERTGGWRGVPCVHSPWRGGGVCVLSGGCAVWAGTVVMRFEPDRPNHDRYQVRHDFLPPEQCEEVLAISKIVNAFFR